MNIVDWIARTTMLVLAALATLALIGSLASVSNAPIGQAFPGQVAVQEASAPDSPPASTNAPREPADAETPDTAAATGTIATVQRIAAQRDAEVARWLKALTYAVIALTAIAAAGVVALARIGGHLARIAER